ncbi:MAG: MmcQ/YjbR family DNA-binding protein [Clostridiales bacterium]|nr:MmcQ/YjbR family DNA-binding protein [Clostridiales bacterium]
MNFENVRRCFLDCKGSIETFPFGQDIPVFKVGNKMFGLIGSNDGNLSINIKNEPFVNEMLRMEHLGIVPGYHMNKKHWNTVYLDLVQDSVVIDLIHQSYLIVLNSLSNKTRKEWSL